jgi:hypothetical protein
MQVGASVVQGDAFAPESRISASELPKWIAPLISSFRDEKLFGPTRRNGEHITATTWKSLRIIGACHSFS